MERKSSRVAFVVGILMSYLIVSRLFEFGNRELLADSAAVYLDSGSVVMA